MSYRQALIALSVAGFKTIKTALYTARISSELKTLSGEGGEVSLLYRRRSAVVFAAGPTPAVEIVAVAPRPR